MLAPELMGADPREVLKLNRLMDAAMAGQQDVKTPLDMALWDLAGQAAGLPLAECLGGAAASRWRSTARSPMHSVDFHNWVTVSNAEGLPPVDDGRMQAPHAPGLGVTPRKEAFGAPLFQVEM